MADDFDEKTKALQALTDSLGEKDDITEDDLKQVFAQITENVQSIAEAAMVKKIEEAGDAPDLNEQIQPFQEIITLSEKLKKDASGMIHAIDEEANVDVDADEALDEELGEESDEPGADFGLDVEALGELMTLAEKLGATNKTEN